MGLVVCTKIVTAFCRTVFWAARCALVFRTFEVAASCAVLGTGGGSLVSGHAPVTADRLAVQLAAAGRLPVCASPVAALSGAIVGAVLGVFLTLVADIVAATSAVGVAR